MLEPAGQGGEPETPLADCSKRLEDGRTLVSVKCFRHMEGVLVVVSIVEWTGESQKAFSSTQLMSLGTSNPIEIIRGSSDLRILPRGKWRSDERLEIVIECE
ncbi:MAG: hypothetical protein DWQ01_10865 [Planctomycetota bacterium]|nr:MAG: hypothetical protein DWQ01_10865 [Planctomycetota bacterium]